jgi:protein EFR3
LEWISLRTLFLFFLFFQTPIFEVLAPSFQIAFSLMSHSLGGTGEQFTICLELIKTHVSLVSDNYLTICLDSLPPSRRRSLFTLATSMIVFASRAFNVAPLLPICKLMLNDGTVRPIVFLSIISFFVLRK